MDGNWTFNDLDRKLTEQLGTFLPEKVIDMHAHIWNTADLNCSPPSLFMEGPSTVTVNIWRAHMEQIFGKSTIHGGLLIGVPEEKCDIRKVNGFVSEQVKNEKKIKGSILVTTKSSNRETLDYLDDPGMIGLKPYHTLCDDYPTFQAHLSSYLPEWTWQAANERNLIITIHLVRDKALCDVDNQRELIKNCRKYPDARVILAHAARGFNPRNTVEGISALKGIKNIWFDMSGICEATAITAILREFGPERLLWGSDFPVSHIRGKCVSAGDGFVWLQHDTLDWNKLSPPCSPTLVCIESLRALKEAAGLLGLVKAEIDGIFYGNGYGMLGSG
jgi:glutamate-1-semialdehyde 2,1-aminomutase